MALEWLKTILGDAHTEDIDKKVSEHIGKSFVSKEDFNTANNAKKTLETQISERDTQLEALKKVDVAGLQAEISRLQGENKTSKTKYEADIKKINTDNALFTLLINGKAKHPDLLIDKFDREKVFIKEDNKTLEGGEAEMKRLKEIYKDQFGSTVTGDPPANPDGSTKEPADMKSAIAQHYNN